MRVNIKNPKLFRGLKILDLSRVFSGPFATRHFADLGAEVIKIEPPGGDDSRKFPPIVGNWSGYYEMLNRNKKTRSLDFKKNTDLEKFYNLCIKADVIVENFTPGKTKKLKIDYSLVSKLNPRIIYASIVGVSEKTERKYYDVIAQAESGLISLNGDKEDMKISTSIIDAFSGMKLAFAISSALFQRSKTGKGSRIIVSMKGSAFELLEQNLIEASVTGKNPGKVGNMDNAIAPFGLFKTKDGIVALAAGNENLWQKLSGYLKEKNHNFEVDKFNNNSLRLSLIKDLKKEMEKVFIKIKTNILLDELRSMGIPAGKVNKMTDILNNKDNYEEGLLVKYKNRIGTNVVSTFGGILIKSK